MGFVLSRENKKRDEGFVEEKYRGMTEEEMEELGDDSPRHRFGY